MQHSLDKMEHVNEKARDCLRQVICRRKQAATNEAQCTLVKSNSVYPSLLSKPQLVAEPKVGETTQRLGNKVRDCTGDANYSSTVSVCQRKVAPKVHVKQELGILFLLSLPRKQVSLHDLTENSAVLTCSISGLVTASLDGWAHGIVQYAILY